MDKTKYDNYLSFINSNITKFIPECIYKQDIISEAMLYSLENGGKRIRPVLTLEFCNLICSDYKRALGFACAIEMIHTYSLIHDDLPCMDNDDLRRGKPSNHIRFGEANALLAGDALLTHAFSAITEANDVSFENRVKVVKYLSESAGIGGMIGGQVLDLQNENNSLTAEELVITHSLKTGALISASAVLGCLAADADDKSIEAAKQYSSAIGIAFQIVDDILDVSGDEKVLGKPVGSDEQNDKTTFVTIYGIEQSKKLADFYTDTAIKSLDSFEGDTTFLKELAVDLSNRNK